MATLEITPEDISSVHRKKWTVEEFDRLSEAGFLPERCELIEGEIIEKMTPNPPHVISVTLLAVWLQTLFGLLYVRTQAPITLPGISHKPEPDVAVTRAPTTAYLLGHPAPDDLSLVAEVSDATLAYDLDVKARLYASAGITEYWALDIVGRRLIVHREPATTGYQVVTAYGEEKSVSPLTRPETTTVVSTLLPPHPSGAIDGIEIATAK